jgi:hypothetical protein
MTDELDIQRLPAIKFFKDAVDDILSGAKTLEPRPRSEAWIRKISASSKVRMTYGPRMGAPFTFAVAAVLDVAVRGLETATQEDVDRIGSTWKGKDPAFFIREYTAWYRKELDKGYPVAWISFEVIPGQVT